METSIKDPKAVALITGPTAPDPETAARWLEGQRRGRLLDGLWRQDLQRALSGEFEPTRLRLQGPVDVTKNLFRSLITQIAVLYDQAPLVVHEDPRAALVMEQVTDDAGLWQLATSHQQSVLGLREGGYRLDVPPSTGELLVRVVPAYLLWAEAAPHDPDVPVTVHEYRIRCDEKGREMWTRDVLSIADPDRPVYRVESADGKLDMSALFLGGSLSGDAYPYRFADGKPFLPFILYHATRTGKMWDPFRGIELVDGTLTIAGLWTQWRHLVRDASWPQRWGINVQVDGLSADGNTGDVSVMTDPATMVSFSPKVPGQGASVGQFAPGGDPKELGSAIRDYAADLAADFDLSPSDIQRTHTDPRSGFAIEVSRSGKRAAQRRFEPQFQRGDAQTLTIAAALLNRANDAGLPEAGWSVKYRGLPLGMEERKLLMEDHKMRAEMGVTSKPHLLAQLEGITVDQARDMLRQFAVDNAEFQGMTQPTTIPDPSEDPDA